LYRRIVFGGEVSRFHVCGRVAGHIVSASEAAIHEWTRVELARELKLDRG